MALNPKTRSRDLTEKKNVRLQIINDKEKKGEILRKQKKKNIQERIKRREEIMKTFQKEN